MRRTFRTQTLGRPIVRYFFSDAIASAIAYSGHFIFLGARTETTTTVAVVDRFYRNFVVGLRFDVALLMQFLTKSYNICLSYKKSIYGVTFFPDTVYKLKSALRCIA